MKCFTVKTKKLNKKLIIYSIISGLLLGFSWPTYGFVYLIFIAFVPILFVEFSIRNESIIKVFSYSFICFFLWNIISSWWLINSTIFGMAFAICLYSTLMSLLFTSFSLISKKLNNKLGLIYFVCAWIVFEKFNLNWEFSWPLLLIGNAFSESHMLVQWYEYTGTFGGTLWVLLINIIFFKAYQNYRQLNYKYLKLFSIGLILVAIPIIISLFIYKNHKNDSRSVELAVIQPNIDPYNDKYGRTNLEILDEFKETTKELDFNNKLIVTPETYFSESPGYLLDNFFNTPFYKDLNSYLIKKNSQILSGIQFYKTYNSNETKTITSNYIRKNLWVDIYNSSFINSEKKQVYHKSKLVVGVENLPYKSVLKPILGNILLDFGGTVMSRASQNERTVYETKNDFKVAPIICYESMYGEFINEYIRNGAEFLAIITNDGWWGDSQGHKQLLSLSRLRAIESRRSIVRSANTGISAIIDSRGNIVKSIPYNKKGVIFGEIKVSEKITFYNIYGDFIYRISLFLFLIVFLFYFAKKK